MSDIRGIPRRSKTAVVVVIVVFLQMLALAVVGIGAIKEDRERGRQARIHENDNTAKLRVTQLRADILKDLAASLRQALDEESSWARLRSDRASWPAPFVRQVFRYEPDPTGGRKWAIYWIEKDYVLFQSPEATRFQRAVYESPDRLQERGDLDLYAAHQSRDVPPLQRLAVFRNAMVRFPVLVVPTERGPWPKAAGWANDIYERGILIDAARAEAKRPSADGEGAAVVRGAVFQSLIVASLNADQAESAGLDAFNRRLIERIPARIQEALPRIPENVRGNLEQEIADYQAHRAFLASAAVRGDLLSFHRGGAELADGSVPYVRLSGSELFAMKRHSGGRFGIARLNVEALDGWIRERVADAHFRQWGMELRVRGRDASGEDTGEDLLLVQDIEEGELQLPFELALVKVADVVGEVEGQSEVWYWAIICLAGMGLGFGGIMLVRLWRREVRLARLKADFVSNLSHELKTPLTSISLFTEMLKEGKFEGAPDDQAEAYEVLDQEAQRLQRIVRRMIETARNEAQGVAHALGPGDLNRPVLEATNRFRRIVTEPGLDLGITLAPEPLPMLLDPSAMDDVVTNLLTNSWKYKRGDTARIRVRTARRGRRGEVIVTDDGIGIPRRERKRVFETFFRAEQYLTQPVAGTGLGLALVRTIVRAHKGRIRVSNGENGLGTTFRLSFPLSRKAAYAAANPSMDEDNDESGGSGPGAGAPRSEGVENTGATA